jgi:hypothetical protein
MWVDFFLMSSSVPLHVFKKIGPNFKISKSFPSLLFLFVLKRPLAQGTRITQGYGMITSDNTTVIANSNSEDQQHYKLQVPFSSCRIKADINKMSSTEAPPVVEETQPTEEVRHSF